MFSANVQANPIITKTDQDIFYEPSILVIPEDKPLANEVEVKKDSFTILENTVNSNQPETTSSCLTFTPLTNTVTPNISSTKKKENEIKATSNCATDLIEISNPKPLKVFQNKNSDFSLNLPETSPKSSQDLPVVETTQPVEDNRWHFKLQPYATIPINTYGTVSARGETVSYHLSLGELLDTLRATASGRFEGWNGRWGFIIDGYFASLQDIGNLQISRSRNPNPINVLNFLLNRGINTRLQEVVNVIDQEIQIANNIQQVREAQPFQNLERQVQDLKVVVSEDAQKLQELQIRFQEFEDKVITGRQQIEVLETRVEDLQDLESQINTLQNFKTNFINNINTEQFQAFLDLDFQNLNQLANQVSSIEQVGQELRQTRNNLERASQRVKELRSQRDSVALENVETKLEEAKALLNDELITDEEKLESFLDKLEELKNIESDIDLVKEIGINDIESLEKIIALRVQDLPIIDDLQDLNNQIQELNQLTDINQIEQKLIQTRDNLERVSQQVKELRSQQDSETLQNLDSQLEQAKVLLDREIQAVNQIQDFLENQQPQQLEATIGASLQFDQGIYDFALSYHIGDLPSHELPEQPSNRNFPLIWFQPIVGVRLNDISVEIDTINRFELSSSLVNIQGTVQRKFERGRTWFEPLLGGKFGIQISDPITFWLRGDASGFGLAGETDISWNLLFGLDWWIHQQISLQLGYHFYEIDYKTGNDNDFRFEENLNGPFVSATFHF
ncbi:hypothetical protein [Crocosphaera subtropica]|uniref:hypothetical protein n=1 Tax=Crocosphaera subtropica TaxID=2546360 RepID=UPI0002E96DC4|nr:hypothetical protein [Crocosphaera subtropica]